MSYGSTLIQYAEGRYNLRPDGSVQKLEIQFMFNNENLNSWYSLEREKGNKKTNSSEKSLIFSK